MKGIRIVSKVDGFRRGGMAHTGSGEYPLSDFTDDQLKLIRAEPNLIVQDIDLPDPEGEAKAPAKTPAKPKDAAKE